MDEAHQAPLCMGFFRQENWSGLPFPSPGDLMDSGIDSDLPHYRQILYHLSHQGISQKDTGTCQDPLSMEFSRQENWSGLPFPSPGDLPNPGMEPRSPALQADYLPFELPGIYMLQLLLLSRFSRV